MRSIACVCVHVCVFVCVCSLFERIHRGTAVEVQSMKRSDIIPLVWVYLDAIRGTCLLQGSGGVSASCTCACVTAESWKLWALVGVINRQTTPACLTSAAERSGWSRLLSEWCSQESEIAGTVMLWQCVLVLLWQTWWRSSCLVPLLPPLHRAAYSLRAEQLNNTPVNLKCRQ